MEDQDLACLKDQNNNYVLGLSLLFDTVITSYYYIQYKKALSNSQNIDTRDLEYGEAVVIKSRNKLFSNIIMILSYNQNMYIQQIGQILLLILSIITIPSGFYSLFNMFTRKEDENIRNIQSVEKKIFFAKVIINLFIFVYIFINNKDKFDQDEYSYLDKTTDSKQDYYEISYPYETIDNNIDSNQNDSISISNQNNSKSDFLKSFLPSRFFQFINKMKEH